MEHFVFSDSEDEFADECDMIFDEIFDENEDIATDYWFFEQLENPEYVEKHGEQNKTESGNKTIFRDNLSNL